MRKIIRVEVSFLCQKPWEFDKAKKVLFCPCHESVFDPKTGQPTTPPAVLPLKSYKVQIEVDKIVYLPRS